MKKKKTLKDIMSENRAMWERTHNQAFEAVEPNKLLQQGHDIIKHHHKQLEQDISRAIQIHALLDQWGRSLDQRLNTLEYHFSWLKEQNENKDTSH